MESPSATGLVLLDACCLINLFGTGRADEILASSPVRFAVARYVAEEEVLEIGAHPRDETSREGIERVALHPLLAELTDKGVLEQLDVTTAQEQRELVRFAAELDDGEAHTCALALVRRARIATDDRKAVRVFTAASKGRGETEKPVLRTSELLFSWAEQHKIPDLELVHIVTAVVSRASFAPPRDDPHFERWMALLGRVR